MASVPMPVVLGHEIVGTIVALGEGVTADCTGRPIKEGDLDRHQAGRLGQQRFLRLASRFQPTLSPGAGAYGFAAKSLNHSAAGSDGRLRQAISG